MPDDIVDDAQDNPQSNNIPGCPIGQPPDTCRWCLRKPVVALFLTTAMVMSVVAIAWLAISREDALRAGNATRQAAVDNKNLADREHLARKKSETLLKQTYGMAELARNTSYISHLQLAQQAWDDSRPEVVLDWLDRQLPVHTNNIDYRDFEWHYLRRQCQSELVSLTGNPKAVLDVTFSPDGKRVATAGQDGSARIWDARNGKLLINIAVNKSTRYASPIHRVAFGPQGTFVASAGSGGIKLWDAQTGQLKPTLSRTDFTTLLAISPDGRYLAGRESGQYVIWDLRTGQVTHSLRWLRSVAEIAFSPDGKYLALAGGNRHTDSHGEVIIVDHRTGDVVRTLETADQTINCLAYRPDGTEIATGHLDGAIRTWDLVTSEPIHTWRGHSEAVNCLTFSPDGSRIASCSCDRTAKLWDVQSRQVCFTVRGHSSSVHRVALSPDGNHMATCAGQKNATGEVKIWDIGNGLNPRRLTSSQGDVYDVKFSPNGQLVASAHAGRTVTVWEPRSGREVFALTYHLTRQGPMTSVSFSPDGQLLATGHDDGVVKIWSVNERKELRTISGHKRRVNSVEFSPDSQHLASGSRDGWVRVWNHHNGDEVLSLRYQNPVADLTYSPDGQQLACAYSDQLPAHSGGSGTPGAIRVWNVQTGKPTQTLRGHEGVIHSITYDATGERLATASADRSVIVWDVSRGERLTTLSGHTDAVLCAAFNPDGRRLISAGRDRVLRLWNPATGQQICQLKGHKGDVHGIQFSPDGAWLASGGLGKEVLLWDARPVTAQLRAEREALGLLKSLYTEHEQKSSVIAAIHDDQSVSPVVRESAVALAEFFPDSVNREPRPPEESALEMPDLTRPSDTPLEQPSFPEEEVISSTDLKANGVFGFPQQSATVVCDQSDLRVSVWTDVKHLFVQAILWKDSEDRLETDRSSLAIDVDGDEAWNNRVDKTFYIHPSAKLRGLRPSGQGGGISARPYTAGRGSIRYVAADTGPQIRVDTYLIPLKDLGKKPGDTLRFSYWAFSKWPTVTRNSVDFQRQGPPHWQGQIPLPHYHELVLSDNMPIAIEQVPDSEIKAAPKH